MHRRGVGITPLLAAAAMVRPVTVAHASSLKRSNVAKPGTRNTRVWVNGRSLVVPDVDQQADTTESISSLRQRKRSRRHLTESVQTYFLPLKEDQLLETMKVVSTSAAAPIQSMTSIVVAANNTIIWYDHWEDGYEDNVLSPISNTTKIWGDGDASNGCAPTIPVDICTDAIDILTPGTAIVVEDPVEVPRDSSIIWMDGGDRIDASFPIAITRAAYPQSPGAVLGGAVEVIDADTYGTYFDAPVGVDMGALDTTKAFEFVEYHAMAREDGTTVTHIDGTEPPIEYELNAGDAIRIPGVKVGDSLSSTRPIQVDLLTGDIGSSYETRWYSVLPLNQWGSDYYTPVGVEKAGELHSKVFLYNPGNDPITINYDDKTGQNVGTVIVPAGGTTSTLLDGATGYRFHSANSADVFFGVTQTDTVSSGEVYDWGHPLIPASELTSRVIVGMGYACTSNTCTNDSEQPSPIWVTPVEDAIISVDYESDGIIDVTYNVTRLDQKLVTDAVDQDMSGASIYANKLSDPSTEVDIAVVWGQDPNQSGSSRSHNLDMGTSIVPLPFIEALKTCKLFSDNDNDGEISPGDELRCTIRVTNTGQQTVNDLRFIETLDSHVTYVEDSTTHNGDTITDSTSGDPFPLSDDGVLLDNMDVQVSADAEISYNVIIDPIEFLPTLYDTIEDTGTIQDASGTDLAGFDTRTGVNLNPSIMLQKTVTTGECPGVDVLDFVYTGNMVNYCFTITNTGNTELKSVNFTDPLLSLDLTYPDERLPINGTWSFSHTVTVYDNATNTANVQGMPIYEDGTAVPEFSETGVSDNDSAQVVAMSYPLAESTADNTVCHYVNMTTTETIEIRGFQFHVNSTDCLSVTVYAKEDGGAWYPMCIGEVIGNAPNYTVVPSFFCSVLTLTPDSTVSFKVATEPSTSCYDGGYIPYNSLETYYYQYQEKHCSPA